MAKKNTKVKRTAQLESDIAKSSLELDSKNLVGKDTKAVNMQVINGVVTISSADPSFDSTDERNQLANNFQEESLELVSSNKTVTIKKVGDNEVPFALDEVAMSKSEEYKQQIQAANDSNRKKEQQHLDPQEARGAIVIESESYKDLVEILNYQDGKKR